MPFMQVGHNSVELAMEWLFSHPEDPSAAAAPAPVAAEPATGVAQQLKLAPAQVALLPNTSKVSHLSTATQSLTPLCSAAA